VRRNDAGRRSTVEPRRDRAVPARVPVDTALPVRRRARAALRTRRQTPPLRPARRPRLAQGQHQQPDQGEAMKTANGASRVWTVKAVRQLGMTTDVETAAAIIGIGRTLAYDLVRTDQFPVRLIRLGRRVVVPVPDLLKLLGAD